MLDERKRWKFILLGLLIMSVTIALLAPAYAAEDPKITGVKVMDRTGTIKVVVTAAGPVSCKHYRVGTPCNGLVLELFPATLAKDVTRKFDVNYGLVENVRVVQASDKPATVKIIVGLINQVNYDVKMAAGNKGVTLELGSALIATAKAPKAVAIAAPAPVEKSMVPEKPAAPVRPAAPAKPAIVKKPAVVTPPAAPTVAEAPAAPAYKPPAAAKRKPAAPKEAKEKTVSMDFVNADLVYVLKILAKELNLNIITDPEVKGAVTMTLKSVPANAALNLIVKMSGYEYKKVDNTIVVGSSKVLDTIPDNIMKIKKGREVTQVIPLENAKPADLQSVLASNFPDAKIQVESRLNALIVKADPSSIKQIKVMVSQLDVPVAAPPAAKSEVLMMKYAKAKDISSILQKLVPSVGYQIDERLNAMVVTGYEDAIGQVKDYLNELDVPLRQVCLEVKVVDISEEGRKTLGGNWGIGGTVGQIANFTLTEQNPNNTIPIGWFTRSTLSLTASLDALISSTQAKVLASPKVATISGNEAIIHIGRKYPVVYYDPRAGQYQVIYVDIGTKVVITPTVQPDGYISMKVQPDISTLLGLVNNQYPYTANRTATAYVRVKDGETMVLGGLISEDDTITKQRIPLLGDLPIVGALFRHESTTRTKNEVVILITPKIIAQ